MQKKNRGKRIIMAVTVAAVLAVVVILLVCGGSNVGANAPGNKKTAEQEQTTSGTKEKKTEKGNLPGKVPKSPGAVVSQAGADQDSFPVGVVGEESRQESDRQWSTQQPPVSTGNQIYRQESQTGATQPAEHVHAYVVTGTRKVEHPAVTEQVWVEDSAAWDEIIRAGYHVSVVTCHECGAQFSDPYQANALEAWGNHIDAAHDGDGGYDMAASYDVPAEILHHDASGHYETRTVTAAWTELIDTYTCPCGDTYTKSR